MPRETLHVAAAQLRKTYDPAELGFETTSELTPLSGIMGQERALAALRFGLDVEQPGFNVYVSGPRGIGKMTALRAYLDDKAADAPRGQDLVYVNDFEDPYSPNALVLPAGEGRKLCKDMQELVEHARQEVPRAFESEEYSQARRAIRSMLSDQQSETLEALDRQARKANHAIKLTPIGIVMNPILGDRELTESEVSELPESAREEIQAQGKSLEDHVHTALRQLRSYERKANESRHELDRAVATYVVGELIDELRVTYEEREEVVAYLDRVQEQILEDIDVFKAGEEVDPRQFREYQVNVIVDRSKETGGPLVVETNPSYVNLFGRIQKEGDQSGYSTDFTMIRSGSMHRANGGFLVLKVEDLVRSLFSWDALKRALQSGQIEIEEPAERLGLTTLKTLQPEPIPLDLNVILVGPGYLYYLLHRYDPDFPELFKVKADFQDRIDATPEHQQQFVRFLAKFCSADGQLPLDAAAVARLLEYSTRRAGDQSKLSALFGELCDVVREAEFWAKEEEAEAIGAAHVERCLEQREYRSNLLQERIQDAIAEGTLRIETEGAAVGQINGLSVITLDAVSFGRPSRISATSGPGREGIVDIERKIELSGAIHAKGVMILNGYLLETYAQERPLSVSARLAFEQSYSEIDGDSASCAELYALLSSIADVPLKQGIAVTGSVDQHGVVQAVGGLNEKVEGFFAVCKARGLTGDQGVLLPHTNLRHLMLAPEVVEAVEAGQFNVWAAERFEDGIELLTGLPAGERDAEGVYPQGSFNARVEERLEAFSKRTRAHSDEEEEEQERLILTRLSARPSEPT